MEQEYTFANGVTPAYVERLDYESDGFSVFAVLQAESGPYVRLEFYDYSNMIQRSVTGSLEADFPQAIESLFYKEYEEEGVYIWFLKIEGHMWAWLSEYPVENGAGNRAEAEERMRSRDRRYRFRRWLRPFHKLFRRSDSERRFKIAGGS
jgi:hypothetical protein